MVGAGFVEHRHAAHHQALARIVDIEIYVGKKKYSSGSS